MQMKQAVTEQGLEIDNLRERLSEVRGQIQASKRDGNGLTQKNTRLYHLEGEKSAELATLRGDTSKQMAANQEFEGQIELMRAANARLVDECEEIDNQRAKIERQAGDHRGKSAQTGAVLREIELNIEQQLDEMRLNEEQIN